MDVFIEYTSLGLIATKLYKEYGAEVLNIWQKFLIKRMSREGLLGKNMNHFVSTKMISESKLKEAKIVKCNFKFFEEE